MRDCVAGAVVVEAAVHTHAPGNSPADGVPWASQQVHANSSNPLGDAALDLVVAYVHDLQACKGVWAAAVLQPAAHDSCSDTTRKPLPNTMDAEMALYAAHQDCTHAARLPAPI